MRLFIAREAVDAHLTAAGEVIEPGLPAAQKARAAAKAGRFYARWLPTLVAGEGQMPRAYAEFGPLAHAPAVCGTGEQEAGPRDVLRHGQVAGQAGTQAGLPGPASSTSAPSCSR